MRDAKKGGHREEGHGHDLVVDADGRVRVEVAVREDADVLVDDAVALVGDVRVADPCDPTLLGGHAAEPAEPRPRAVDLGEAAGVVEPAEVRRALRRDDLGADALAVVKARAAPRKSETVARPRFEALGASSDPSRTPRKKETSRGAAQQTWRPAPPQTSNTGRRLVDRAQRVRRRFGRTQLVHAALGSRARRRHTRRRPWGRQPPAFAAQRRPMS